jgi:hypothetical protein
MHELSYDFYLCKIHGVLATLDTNPSSRAKVRFLVSDLENICHFLDGHQSELGSKDVVETIQCLI